MSYTRPLPPSKDVAKRLPPTKKSSSNQLGSIRESRTESIMTEHRSESRCGSRCGTPLDSHSTSSSEGVVRRKVNVSLFPDPARHQNHKQAHQLRITIPSIQQHPKSTSKTTGSEKASNSADEGLTGLARARRKAMESRKRENFSPLFDELNEKRDNKEMKSAEGINNEETLSVTSKISSSTDRIRRKLSTRLRRQSRSLDSFPMDSKSPGISSPESCAASTSSSTIYTPATSTSSSSRNPEKPSSPVASSSSRLQSAVSLNSSHMKHVRQSSSTSSINSPAPVGASSDENSETKKRHGRHGRSGSKGLPRGMSPSDAAKQLPSSVKIALGIHAHSESMSYPVLLPHEVVQLNDEHLGLEKQIDSIKKELNAVRHQSAELHEKMLDELRTCATASMSNFDSGTFNRLLHLQIDVATIEVRLDHTSRRLWKAQHRRAEVRERLLMHLAGTHAMLEYEKRDKAKGFFGSTPPESPVE